MAYLRLFAALALAGALLVTGCGDKPPTSKPPTSKTPVAAKQRPELVPPIETALTALRDMNAAGKNKDIPGARQHFQQFRENWKTVKVELDKEDPKLAVHIDDGVTELDLEFAKPADQFRLYELDEETVKLGRLLSRGAALLGAAIREDLVQKDPTMDLPYNKAVQVKIDLVDHKFKPEVITVDQHTKVTFVLINKGKDIHEFAVGYYGIEEEEIKPGETRELTMVTLDSGEYEIACYYPGHYEVGMHGKLIVNSAELKQK